MRRVSSKRSASPPSRDHAADRSALVKLTRPSAAGLLHRDRLFALLDAARGDRLVWITGAAGAGKTSLVSSWIEARRMPHAWYQVDAGDADPGTLFHFFALLGAQAATGKAPELPALTPERLPGLEVFARRFFEALFACLPRSSALIVDDCQEAAPDSPFGGILAAALGVMPSDRVMICLSREEPPPALARWQAHPGFRSIGGDHLRLTDPEARALARLAGDDRAIDRLNEVVRGWAAGLTLLLRARRAGLAIEAPRGTPPKPLFDYFAAEIFAKTPPALRDFLLRTALLPWVSPETARALTGHDDASDLLAWFHRNHLFTERRERGPAGVVYEFHPLFRGFLLERARRELDAEARVALMETAARALEQAGADEDAVALWTEAGAWAELGRLVCAQAPTLAAEGRFGTIGSWVGAIPDSVCEATPWLLYWRGVCQGLRDPGEGRKSLEKAFPAFKESGDVVGRFLALAAIFTTYFEAWDDHAPVDRWNGELDALLAETGGVIPSPVEAQVIGSLSSMVMRRPEHPPVKVVYDRGLALVQSLPDVDQWSTISASTPGSHHSITRRCARP